jgi:hypothetical protein
MRTSFSPHGPFGLCQASTHNSSTHKPAHKDPAHIRDACKSWNTTCVHGETKVYSLCVLEIQIQFKRKVRGVPKNTLADMLGLISSTRNN